MLNYPEYLRAVKPSHRMKARFRDGLVRAATNVNAVSPLLRMLEFSSRKLYETNPRMSSNASLQTANKILIFAHYDAEKIVSAPDRRLLAELRKCGYATLVVSTAVDSDEEHAVMWSSVQTEVDGLITRPNIGFDFGSWADGIGALGLSSRQLDQLLLLNNSVYGPMRPLAETLEEATKCGEVFSFVASSELKKHFPSVFLGFHTRVIASEAFREYWSSYPTGRWKNSTILRGELNLAQFFKDAGFDIGCLYKSTEQFPRNPHTFLYRDLIMHGYPFLKKSLFHRNYDDLEMTNWSVGLDLDVEMVNLLTDDVTRLRRLAGLN